MTSLTDAKSVGPEFRREVQHPGRFDIGKVD